MEEGAAACGAGARAKIGAEARQSRKAKRARRRTVIIYEVAEGEGSWLVPQ
jgi:hypothetical protein